MTQPVNKKTAPVHTGGLVIKATGIRQTFKLGGEEIPVLKEISFDMREKSFNIIYGPSGSGKSTLLNILTGLQAPSQGTIEIFGRDMYSLSPDDLAHFRANEIGIVYQQNYWVKSLNVIENVGMPLYFSGYSRPEAAKKALEALQLVGMQDYAKKHPALLSGGEQQRIAMARALINDPKIIIADEPTGSLDSKNGDMVMALLHKFQTELGRTIILVTHNMEYLPFADHLLKIQDGVVTRTTDGEGIRKIASDLLRDIRARIDTIGKTNL
jgi:ABC-type lipoprotein export system ATPase subunit